MKRLFTVLAVLFALGLSTSAFAKDTSVTLKVKGWHCAHCAAHTAKALEKIKGVEKVTTATEKGTVVVKYDDAKTNLEALKKAVKGSGFTVAS